MADAVPGARRDGCVSTTPLAGLSALLVNRALADDADYQEAEGLLRLLKDARERVEELRAILAIDRYLGTRTALDDVRDELNADINRLIAMLDEFDEQAVGQRGAA